MIFTGEIRSIDRILYGRRDYLAILFGPQRRNQIKENQGCLESIPDLSVCGPGSYLALTTFFLGVAVVAVWRAAFWRYCPLAPFTAKLLVHLHFYDLLDDTPEQFLYNLHDVGNTDEVLTWNILL